MIKEIIEKYVDLKKSGKNYVGLCPFHGDTKPSLIVNDEKNIYKCFACGAGGNALKFVQDIENCNYQEAKIKINEILNFDFYKITNSIIVYKNIDFKTLVDIATYTLFYTEYYDKVISYFNLRKINEDTIKKYEIGFFRESNDQNFEIFKNNGLNEVNLKNLGVLSDEKEKYFYFNNRIVIPHKNNNNYLGFISRAIDDNNLRYLNSKDLNKNFLFGIDQLDKKTETIFITEGVFDCLTLSQIGYNAVCTLGANCNINQFKQLYSFENLRHICICFDNDKAGFANSIKLYKELTQNFKHCYISFIDYYKINEKDINEMYTNNENLLINLCENTIDLNVFKLNELIKRKLDPNHSTNWNVLEQSIKIQQTKFVDLILDRLTENNFDALANKFKRDLIDQEKIQIINFLLDENKKLKNELSEYKNKDEFSELERSRVK